jgi:hypothetical protein
MKTPQTIEVKVALDGGISIDAIGFKGSDCEQATAFLEEALGVTSKRKRKVEYHQRKQTRRQQQNLKPGSS